MTNTSWELIGTEYGSCNCDYGCPCQFMGKPSSPAGDCRYATFNHIDEGHYGDVDLDGDSADRDGVAGTQRGVVHSLAVDGGATGAAQVEQDDGAVVVDVDHRMEVGEGFMVDLEHRGCATPDGDALGGQLSSGDEGFTIVDLKGQDNLLGVPHGVLSLAPTRAGPVKHASATLVVAGQGGIRNA